MSKKNPKEQAGLSGWQKVNLLHEEVLKLSSHLHIWYHGVYPHPPPHHPRWPRLSLRSP